MIKKSDRIRAFATVGRLLKKLSEEEKSRLFLRARNENSWFTDENLETSLQGVQRYLDEDKLREWTADLPEFPAVVKKVGVVMAGNIPLVGFHDFLSVLISGHHLLAKLSSQDTFLIRYVADILTDIEPRFKEQLTFAERLNEADAIIATGSDNSSRYFEYYFASRPHIIRKNRTSVGILQGNESEAELKALGKDVFQYFGLGCRNISKIYVPKGYTFDKMLDAWQDFSSVSQHHKYNNNYDYNKSVYLVNNEPHYDSGFSLLRESEELVSPISVVYYERYEDEEQLHEKIDARRNKIQCIVSREASFEDSLPFGKAQEPELWDYADQVNTLEFLKQLG
ncbi:MAG: acyl-CoA reductase [Cyclobacteriaceae bacterium]